MYRLEDYQHSVMNRQYSMPVLIVSEKEPDFDKLSGEYSLGVKTLQYPEKLKNVNQGVIYRFLLRGNPTKKVKGKRIPLKTYEERLQWIQKKSDQSGFDLLDCLIKSERIKESVKTDIVKNNTSGVRKITFNSVIYEGTLKITDIEIFKSSLYNGIGSGKAFGFGLMTIAKC